MDHHPSTVSPTTSDRARTTSPLRQSTRSPTTQSPASPRIPSNNDPVPRARQPTRSILRRPSSSAPGLSPRVEHSILTSPISPRPESEAIHHVVETHHIQRHSTIETGNRTINNYEILGDIGSGVHGKVKKAKDCESGVIVAIKIIN